MTKEDILNELFIRQEISLAQYLQLMDVHSVKELKEVYNKQLTNRTNY